MMSDESFSRRMSEAAAICDEKDDSATTTFINGSAYALATELAKPKETRAKCVNFDEWDDASKVVWERLDLNQPTTATIEGVEDANAKTANDSKARTGCLHHKLDGDGEQDDVNQWPGAAAYALATELAKPKETRAKCVNFDEWDDASKVVWERLDLNQPTTATIGGVEDANAKTANDSKAPMTFVQDPNGPIPPQVCGHLKCMANYYDGERPIGSFTKWRDYGIIRAGREYLEEWSTKVEEEKKKPDITSQQEFEYLMSATITHYGPPREIGLHVSIKAQSVEALFSWFFSSLI